MSRYNAPPSVVTLYCAMCSMSPSNADLRPIVTPRHMVHLVRSQPVYHSKRLFSHSGTLNVSGILNDFSRSQAFPLSHSQRTRRGCVSYAMPRNRLLRSPVTLRTWRSCFLAYLLLGELMLAMPCLGTSSCTHQ